MKQVDAVKQMCDLSIGLHDYCRGLEDLGIHLFNVMINYDDNRQVYLCNKPSWVSDYYEHELNQSSLYDNKPTLFLESEFALWEENTNQPIMQFGRSFYDNYYGLTLTQRRDRFTAFYFFAGSLNHSYLPQFLINNLNFFEQFVMNFNSKNQFLLEKAQALGLQRIPKSADSPWGERAVGLMQAQQQRLKNKCMQIRQNYHLAQGLYSPLFKELSPRQKQVLYGVANGQSAKVIADKLNISHRTVERHLSLLKNKFPQFSSVELLLELLGAQPKDLLLS